MQINYIVTLVKPAFLQEELLHLGKKGWDLVTIVLLQTIKPGMTINGQPQIELNYQLFFKKPMDNGKEGNAFNNE